MDAITQEKWRNPSEEFAPSRPGLSTLIITATVVLAGFGVAHSSAVSSFLHFSSLRGTLGF